MHRGATIAIQARRFAKLNEEEFRRHPLDELLCEGADELDLLCARLVGEITEQARESNPDWSGIAQVLGRLSDGRALAIVWALPFCGRRDDLRTVALRALARLRSALAVAPQEDVGEVVQMLDRMTRSELDSPIDRPGSGSRVLSPADRREMEHFTSNALRRQLGLDHDLSDEELVPVTANSV